ncbi:MAG TPA: hypothetical protein VF875_06025 [Anaeromyxobacter sp.]
MSFRAPLLVLAAALAAGCKPKPSCYLPEIDCGGTCVNPTRDLANCGGCGIPCGSGELCCGACMDPSALATDVNNCGACGVRCPAHGVCSSGTCSCPGALPTQCGASPGACVDLQVDPEDCGTCGHACAGLGVVSGDATCAAGACVCAGTPASTDCGGNPACVNTLLDPKNCGGCGALCPPHATCSGTTTGTCGCGAADWPDFCGSTIGCVNLDLDPTHCGSCGIACGGSTPSCSSGKCCPSGETSCSGVCVNTQTSDLHCGTCANACAGAKVCSAGTCACPGASPVVCGSLCCAGTACCASDSACQTKHSNGLGGSFNDCNPLYAPTATDSTIAALAASSWSATGTDFPGLCGGACLGRQTPTSCAVWCYGNSAYAGHVTSGSTINCPGLCANFAGTTPIWQ